MGRPPIGKRAMTPAERQQRRRKRLAKEKAAVASKAKKSRAREKAAAAYIPTPPGITYWTKVTVQTDDGEREIWTPRSKPAAVIEPGDLDDIDLLAAWRHITRLAISRGLVRAGEMLESEPETPP